MLPHLLLSLIVSSGPAPPVHAATDTVSAVRSPAAADTALTPGAGAVSEAAGAGNRPAGPSGSPPPIHSRTGPEGERRGVLDLLWGVEAPDPSLHLGLWAFHLEQSRRGITQHSLIGATWKSYFVGTFVNTYGRRSYGAGVRRVVLGDEDRASRLSLGYRLGLVTGYDERLTSLAGRLPVLPALEVVAGVRLGPVGLHWSWAGVVTQVGTVWYWPGDSGP